MSYQSIGTIDENNSITSSNNRLETTTPSSNGTYLHTSQQKTLCTYISAQGVDDYEDVIIVCNTVTIPFPICQIASIVVITVVASITLIVVFHSLVKNNCLEAPYLYLTTHGRNNIYKYSRDGCLITTKTLKHEHLDATSFRSMAFGPYQGIENALFVASAEGQPQVTVYGNCVQDTNVTSKKKKKIAKGEIINAEASLGERDYLGVLVNRSTSTGAEHAYGIAIGNITGDLYVSFQHTDAVLRFDPSTDYEFFPSPPSSFSQWAPGSYYEGALFQIDTIQSDDNSPNMQGLRGIAAVDDAVWVSDEILNSVFVIDTISGGMLETIAIDAPINLVYDATSGLVYIGSNGPQEGAVFAFNKSSYDIVTVFRDEVLKHPAGLTVYDGVLFVADQKSNSVFTFDVDTGFFIKTIIQLSSGSKFVVEALGLSTC